MAGLRIAGGEITLPLGIITDVSISSDAAISSSKVKQIYRASTNFGLESTEITTAANDKEVIVHVTASAGRIVGFHAILNDTGTSSTGVDFDLKVNGVSILNSLLSITDGEADRLVVDGDVLTDTITVDDVVTIEIATSDSSGNPQGPFAWVDIEEDNAPN